MTRATTFEGASMRADGGALPAFQTHGGRLGAAAAAFPDAPGPWIDLSTGINPWPWPVPAIPADLWARLPDPAALGALEQAAAGCFGLGDAAMLAAVPGTEIGLRQLARLRRGARVAVVSPTYSGHRSGWAEHDVRDCTWAEAEAGGDALDVLILVRPNNPDGLVVAADSLADAAQRLAARGGWLVIDEAFADVGGSLIEAWGGSLPANVILLRSFGKFFGLAGVRLGFVIADRSIVDRVRAALGDWPVSGPALAIGTAAYRDREWQAEMRQSLAAAAVRLDTLLKRHGVSLCGGTSLFRLARTPHASALFDHLARAGILTRPFANQPDWLRFGLPGADEQWRRLDAALSAWELQHDRG